MYRASDRPELGDQHQSLAFWGTQGPTAGIGLSPDPGATLRLVANDLASHSGSFAVGGLFAVIVGGMATWAAPRVWHGVDGWVRHLPADWPAHRRALLGALTAAQLPVAIGWCAMWCVAWSVRARTDKILEAFFPLSAGN